jgi:hypothetical protein
MRMDQRAQRLGAHQWSIARHHHDNLGIAHRSTCDLHRVPGSVLRLLQDGGRAARFYDGHDLLGLMAHNDDGLFSAQRSARP